MSSAESARSDVTNKSEHLRRVREAAEALFKPKVPQPSLSKATAPPAAVVSEPIALAGVTAPPAGVEEAGTGTFAEATTQPTIISQSTTRLARLLPVKRPQVTITATASEMKREIVRNKIPESERSRIRVLTSYGMTIAQVAALYDATIDTIEKIVL